MARKKFKAKGTEFTVPDHLPTDGRGSGAAKAYEKGVRAASRGRPSSSCPYAKGRGSAKFRAAWLRGFLDYSEIIDNARKAAS